MIAVWKLAAMSAFTFSVSFSLLFKYLLVKKSGLDHDPFFKIKVKVKKYNAEFGEGKNIQDAEQNAAKKFLNKLNI